MNWIPLPGERTRLLIEVAARRYASVTSGLITAAALGGDGQVEFDVTFTGADQTTWTRHVCGAQCLLPGRVPCGVDGGLDDQTAPDPVLLNAAAARRIFGDGAR